MGIFEVNGTFSEEFVYRRPCSEIQERVACALRVCAVHPQHPRDSLPPLAAWPTSLEAWRWQVMGLQAVHPGPQRITRALCLPFPCFMLKMYFLQFCWHYSYIILGPVFKA